MSVPIAFVAKSPDMKSQLGVAAYALFVRQTPPPAAAAQTVQLLVAEQLGSTARAVIRPEVVYGAPLNVRTSGKFEVLGPASVQVPFVCGLFDWSFVQAFWAFRVSRNGVSEAG